MTISTRIIAVIGALLVAIVLAVGWFFGVSPLLSKAAESEAARQDVLAQNQLLAAKVAEMKKQFDDIEVYENQLEALHTLIPEVDDRGAFLGNLELCAAQAGGRLTQVDQREATAYLQPAEVDDVISAPGATLAPKLHRAELIFNVRDMNHAASMNFFHCLQSHQPRIVTIQSAELKNTGELEVVAFTYVVADPAQVQARLDAGPFPVEEEESASEDEAAGEGEATEETAAP